MRISEVATPDIDTAIGVDAGKLIALAKFFIGRAKDTGASAKIGLTTFLSMANNLGIGITKESLQQMMDSENQDQTAVLVRNYISNVTPNEIVFKGGQSSSDAAPPQADQSQAIVNQMAQRAIDIK